MVRTQGDIKLFILPGGVEVQYVGGQPIMDSGLENAVLIYLFTERGWALNKIRPINEQIGSDFLAECRKPITISQIRRIEIAAESALKSFGAVGGAIRDLSAKMVSGNQIFLSFVVDPPGSNPTEIELSGFGANWRMQAQEAD